MNKLLILLPCFLIAVSINGQSNPSADEEKAMKSAGATADSLDGWDVGGSIGIITAQTYLDNWAAGGQSSVSFGSLADVHANYKKGNNAWDNSLSVAYGLLLQDMDGRAVKTDDKIDFTSKYGRKASEKWYYSTLFNFRSQFAPGYEMINGFPNYDNKISDWLAPANILVSLGMDYKPNENFTVFLSPATYRLITVMDDDLARIGAFGVQKEEVDEQGIITKNFENTRTEFGGYIRMEYKREVFKNVSYETKLELFSNYLDKPQNIDVNWENKINFKVNEVISAVILIQLKYDDNTIINKGIKTIDQFGTPLTYDIGPGLQFREVFGLNLSYKF